MLANFIFTKLFLTFIIRYNISFGRNIKKAKNIGINFCLTPRDIAKIYTQLFFAVRLSTIAKWVHRVTAHGFLRSLL